MGLDQKDVAISCVIGIISWALLTHWVPSFRWIPYSFAAGILTALLGFVYLLATTSKGAGYAFERHPPLPSPAFVRPGIWQREKALLKARSEYVRTSVFPHSQRVSAAIDSLLDYILRDFVSVWYRHISSRNDFQNEVDRAIRDVLLSIRKRTDTLDLVEIAVARVVPILTNHMRDFYNAERAVRGRNLNRDMTDSEELDTAIASKYRDGKLHTAASLAFADTKLMQQSHLRTTVSSILPHVLSENMKTSPAVMSLVREIVACAVLSPIMLMLCDPDTFNQLMESVGRTMLQDRKTVRRLRAALDEHAVPSPSSNHKPAQFPRLKPTDNERQFERFIRAARGCTTLSDSRRFRSEIASQIRKVTSSPEQDPTFLKRLEAGKRVLDQNIAHLAAGGTVKPKLRMSTSSMGVEQVPRLSEPTLRDVLYNASGLSYFMEFMDRRNRMRLVQFYVVVDGFRNPLEEDNDEPGNSLHAQTSWTPSDRADIEQIYEAYLTKPELHVPDADRKAAKDFLKAGSSANMHLYLAARKAVLRTQTAVFEEMKEQHFDSFKKSELFYKWLSTEEGLVRSATSPTPPEPVGSPLNTSLKSPLKQSWSPKTMAARGNKEPPMRRPFTSSSDLKSFIRPVASDAPARSSMDDLRSRPLFQDDIEDDRMSHSVPMLGTDDTEYDGEQQPADSTEVVDAMQAALNEIMDEPDSTSLFSEPHGPSVGANDSPRGSVDSGRPPLVQSRSKPSIASLGLVGEKTTLGVFSDDLFEEEERFLEDEREDSEGSDKLDEDDIHEAAPGDLGLAEAIDNLNHKVDTLTRQEAILDSLMMKAELTNNAAELRILRKSKQSLQREIHRNVMQKQQYIVQESDNSLYGRAEISIKSIMVGKDPDGREFALYVIEVRRQAGEQMLAAAWAVTRRYSEFHELNKRLRARFPAVKNLEFPRRQTLFTLQKDFLQKRRAALEKYLRSLLLIPAICRSRELRAFLSQSAIRPRRPDGSSVDERDFVTRIYNSVTDGMEEFLGNIPVLDQLSVAGQNLISAATAQLNGVPMNGSSSSSIMPQDPASAADAEAEINGFEDREAEPFVKPICDIFLEIFELQKGTSWLRGRAVVVVLHQLLGGTIEKKVRDAAKSLVSDDSLLRCIDTLKESMWPGGEMRAAGAPRSSGERAQSRKEAGVLLATLLPDLAGSVVGRANAQTASRKVFAMLNNQRLNVHLVFTLLDEIVQIVFPEAVGR